MTLVLICILPIHLQIQEYVVFVAYSVCNLVYNWNGNRAQASTIPAAINIYPVHTRVPSWLGRHWNDSFFGVNCFILYWSWIIYLSRAVVG